MDSDEDDRRIIEEDRKRNPNCGYSISSSSTGSTINGKYVYETSKILQRMCPGQSPVEIFSKSQKQDHPPQSKNTEGGWYDNSNQRSIPQLNEFFENSVHLADQIMGNLFSGFGGFIDSDFPKQKGGSSISPFPRMGPVPQKPNGNLNDIYSSQNSQKKPSDPFSIHGQITGSEEDI
eukprot:gene5587-7713_t